MILDVILIAILIVWTIAGYRKGFVRQIFSLAGLVLMLFFSRPMAELVADILKHEADIDLLGLHFHAMLVALSASCIYICFYLLGVTLHKTLVKGIKLAEKSDHVLGASLGFIQAFIVCYFSLCLIDGLETKIERYAPNVAQRFSTSKCLKYMEGKNYLASFFEDLNHVTDNLPAYPLQAPMIEKLMRQKPTNDDIHNTDDLQKLDNKDKKIDSKTDIKEKTDQSPKLGEKKI